ncbi:MAG: glutamine synthetase beta-grasp domain-containing protein [Alphaproteobacteria bacterium]|nr:glutamine synthetase beta-grasp domain-containing protein [Alphaproteobacteria bacterium]
MALSMCEYIWLGGGSYDIRELRSKACVIDLPANPKVSDFKEWSFDGSSTGQADGHDSDCILKPVTFISDPVRGEGNYLVLCEVYDPDGETPHASNSRAQLRAVLDAGGAKQDPWMGFEQEYTLFQGRTPLGWPEQGYPGPQGPYYCGVGSEEIFGREVVEDHARACMEAGLMFYGINAEVMPGQWEFQIGYRGSKEDKSDALTICDHTYLARWLLYRIAEDYGIRVSFDNKPVKGDWNGAGMHTNVSTKDTRDKSKGKAAIAKAVELLSKKHPEHIAVYGHNLHERLTGHHETCDINTFKSGAADRGCSIRIPRQVETKGYGYFEDRRPGANSDPYLVAARIVTTICDLPESVFYFNSWPRNVMPAAKKKAA